MKTTELYVIKHAKRDSYFGIKVNEKYVSTFTGLVSYKDRSFWTANLEEAKRFESLDESNTYIKDTIRLNRHFSMMSKNEIESTKILSQVKDCKCTTCKCK